MEGGGAPSTAPLSRAAKESGPVGAVGVPLLDIQGTAASPVTPVAASSLGDNEIPVRKLSLGFPGTDATLTWRAPEERSAEGKARRDETTPANPVGARLEASTDLALLHEPTSNAWQLDS